MEKFYINSSGEYLGSFVGHYKNVVIGEKMENDNRVEITEKQYFDPEIPEGAIEVDNPPEHGDQKYDIKSKAWLTREIPAIENLLQTEDSPTLARKIEELIDHINNGAEISTYSKNWANNRKTLRTKL